MVFLSASKVMVETKNNRVFHKINFVLGRWLVIVVSNLIPIVQTETKQDVGLVSSNRTFKDTSTVL